MRSSQFSLVQLFPQSTWAAWDKAVLVLSFSIQCRVVSWAVLKCSRSHVRLFWGLEAAAWHRGLGSWQHFGAQLCRQGPRGRQGLHVTCHLPRGQGAHPALPGCPCQRDAIAQSSGLAGSTQQLPGKSRSCTVQVCERAWLGWEGVPPRLGGSRQLQGAAGSLEGLHRLMEAALLSEWSPGIRGSLCCSSEV